MKQRDYMRDYQQRPEVKKRMKVKNKRYREKNKERLKERAKEYYQQNKDYLLNYHHLYRQNNPEQLKFQHQRYRTKGFIPLLINPFPEEIEINYHHIRTDLPFVIPLPKITHRKVLGGNLKEQIERHELFCKEIIKKIFCLDLNIFLKD
jgi:hypothetical protein